MKKFTMHEFIAIDNIVIYAPSITNVKVDRDWWGRHRLHLTLRFGVNKSIRFHFKNQEERDAALTLVKTAIE